MAHAYRPVRAGDLAAILALAAGWPSHFVAAGLAQIRADFRADEGIVAHDGGRLAGFLLWARRGDELEILWIAVDPDHVRRGIGGSLIEQAITANPQARVITAKTATVDSEIAGTALDGASFLSTHRFFARLGFTVSGLLDRHWGPSNHALVLTRRLGSAAQDDPLASCTRRAA